MLLCFITLPGKLLSTSPLWCSRIFTLSFRILFNSSPPLFRLYLINVFLGCWCFYYFSFQFPHFFFAYLLYSHLTSLDCLNFYLLSSLDLVVLVCTTCNFVQYPGLVERFTLTQINFTLMGSLSVCPSYFSLFSVVGHIVELNRKTSSQ